MPDNAAIPTGNVFAKPGVYPHIAEEIYHGLCTPEPALSAGFAITMLHESAGRAWYDSPLNPKFVPENKAAFDIGRAAHLLMLEPASMHARITIIDCADYRTKVAQEQRDAAYRAGVTPLLAKQYDQILDMRRALRNELEGLPFETAPRFAAKGFEGGRAELSYFWKHPRVGIWCKARPDYTRDQMLAEPGYMVDYKTMALGGLDVGTYAYKQNWHQRAAHYVDGHRVLTGVDVPYWYVAQEKDPPYFTAVFRLPDELIEIGREMNLKAAWEFRRGLDSNRWPGPVREAMYIKYPPWAMDLLQRRHDDGHFDVPAELTQVQKQELFERAREFQAP